MPTNFKTEPLLNDLGCNYRPFSNTLNEYVSVPTPGCELSEFLHIFFLPERNHSLLLTPIIEYLRAF